MHSAFSIKFLIRIISFYLLSVLLLGNYVLAENFNYPNNISTHLGKTKDAKTIGFIDVIKGRVEILNRGDSFWKAARKGAILSSYTKLKTHAKSVVKVKFLNGDYLIQNQKSELVINKSSFGKRTTTIISLKTGSYYIEKKSELRLDRLKIYTPSLVVDENIKTLFLRVYDKGDTDIKKYKRIM